MSIPKETTYYKQVPGLYDKQVHVNDAGIGPCLYQRDCPLQNGFYQLHKQYLSHQSPDQEWFDFQLMSCLYRGIWWTWSQHQPIRGPGSGLKWRGGNMKGITRWSHGNHQGIRMGLKLERDSSPEKIKDERNSPEWLTHTNLRWKKLPWTSWLKRKQLVVYAPPWTN